MRTFSEMNIEEIVSKNTAPHMLRFGFSTACNYNCTMCCGVHSPLGDYDTDPTQLSFEVIIETLDYLRKNGTQGLVFSGVGEPFTHAKIYDIIEYAAQYFIIAIQTNLSLVDTQRLAAIEFTRELTLSVNFNAVSRKEYKAIYGNQEYSNLQKVLNKAEFLRDQKNIYIRLIYVVSRFNKNDTLKTIKLADRLGFDMHLEFSNDLGEKFQILNLTVLEKKQLTSDIKRQFGNRIGKKNIINLEEFYIQGEGYKTGLEKITYCNAPHLYARIDENGDVYPCNNTGVEYLLGNINTQSYEEIWNTKKYVNMRKDFHEGELAKNCCHNNIQANGGNYKIRYFINQ